MKKRKFIDKRNVISSFLPGLIRQKGWEVQVDLHSLFLDWRELMGDVADHATPEKIVKNVLFIQVENAAWIQQFQYRKIELLDIFNGHLRMSRLSDIKFKLATNTQKEKKEKKDAVRFVPPSAEEQEAFRKQISIIDDEKIRESLMRIWYLDHACKRIKR